MKRVEQKLASGRLPHTVLYRGPDADLLAYPDRPGLYDVRSRDHAQLIARYTPQEMLLWCKRCKRDHPLPLGNEELLQAQELLLSGPGAPEWYKIFCIDGRVQIVFPGEPLEGTYFTCLLLVTRPMTND